jgi:deoxyribonuclease-4
MRIGRHMPTGSQPLRALRTAKAIGCEAVQIFVTNPRGWRAPEPHPAHEAAFRAAAAEHGLCPIVVHATYLINLASPRDDFFERSVALLRATLERAARHGAASVVVHIGSHLGAGEEVGLLRLADGIRRVLEGTPEEQGPRLLLENDVGAGGELGYRCENLAEVLAALPEHAGRLGVCIDTAHLWGAGFDVGSREGVERTLATLDATVGLAHVPVVHLNDTKVPLGSHRDVHARVGEGIIGQEGLAALLRAPGLAHAAVLLETPIAETAPGKADWEHDAAHLRRVLALAGREVEEAVDEKAVQQARRPRRVRG